MIRMKRNEEGERRLEGEEIEIRDGKCCEFIDWIKLLVAPPGSENDRDIIDNVIDRQYMSILEQKQLLFKW